MIRKIDHQQMGRSTSLGWLDSHFHFSFADYYNPRNMNFGVLRVINDDLIAAGNGFGTHPHRDMEIVTYMVDGELTHADSMGNKETIGRGEVQYMSAGTGVMHSEENFGKETARLLQIWILPDQHGLAPNYGDHRFQWADRVNHWLHLVSGKSSDAPVQISQDVNIYATELEQGVEATFEVAPGRQAYLINIEGDTVINGQESLTKRDAVEAVEENISLRAETKAHLLVIEMAKEPVTA